MRFCLVSTQQNWGGGEVLIASMATELAKTGHTVGWIVRDGSEVAERIAQRGAAILHRTRRRGQNWRDWHAVREVVRNWAPDVLVMNDTHAVPLAGAVTWFNRTVKPLRLAYKHTIFPLRSKLKYRLLADRIICVSQAAQRTVLRGGLPEKYAPVVYGGADVPTADAKARAQVRCEFGLDDRQPLLVSVGNLLECKGHHDLIEALNLLDSHWNARLVIAGEGEERPHLEQRIAHLGLERRVRLLGYRSDVDRLLQAADVVIHPSHAEGLSLVLIQAQMLARPIVATSVGGAAEVLGTATGDGTTSWIAQPANARDLAEQIEAALQTLSESESRQALERKLDASATRAKRHFSIQRNSLQLADLAAGLLPCA